MKGTVDGRVNQTWGNIVDELFQQLTVTEVKMRKVIENYSGLRWF